MVDRDPASNPSSPEVEAGDESHDSAARTDGPAPEVVAFDIGEVLVDESRVWSIWSELIGTTPLTFSAVLGAAIVQGSDHRDVFAHVAPNIDWAALADEHERRLGGLQAIDLYPDAATCLTQLRELGFRVIIAGNQPAQRTEQLRALQLAADAITTSEDLGAEKPDPAFFARLIELCGVEMPDQILYVGDRVDNDVLPALAIGMRICWLRRGPWGLLQDMPDDVEADLVLEGLGELPELLDTWRST